VKVSIDDLPKAFESRVRLGIMSALAVKDALDFNSLKEYLDVPMAIWQATLNPWKKKALLMSRSPLLTGNQIQNIV